MNEREQKDSHIQAIIYDVFATLQTIEAGTTIWYGGVPVLVDQLRSMLEGTLMRYKDGFPHLHYAPRPIVEESIPEE